jgi:retinol dehydrogenase 12
MWFILELFAKHVPEITSVSVYPGDIKTGLFTTNGGHWLITILRDAVLPLTAVPVKKGVKNKLWAGTAKGVKSGQYYEPVGIMKKQSPYSYDDEVAEKFWVWTEKELEGWES